MGFHVFGSLSLNSLRDVDLICAGGGARVGAQSGGGVVHK